MIHYQVHIQETGWQDPVENGSIAGTVGENRAIEAYRIIGELPEGVGVHSFAYVQDHGWSSGNIQGEDTGSTGLAKHIEAIKMGLFGENADSYNIWYRSHQANLGWMGWSQNGEINGSTGGNNPIQAIQIFIEEKGSNKFPRSDNINAYIDLEPIIRAERERQEAEKAKAAAAGKAGPQEVIKLAQSYIGYVSGSSMDSWFGRQLGQTGNWCAWFCLYIAKQLGLVFPESGYCPTIADWAKKNGRFSKTPHPGFFVLYDFTPTNGNGVADHIGVVESVISGGVNAIEGNTGSPVGVYRKKRTSGIYGYVNPF